MYYTDPYIDAIQEVSTIRMATVNEIIAMKLDVILRGGRKKDFWDLHYFLDKFSIDEMISFFEKRYPYSNDALKIKEMLVNFDAADLDFDPNCLFNKSWELIKIDFAEKLNLL